MTHLFFACALCLLAVFLTVNLLHLLDDGIATDLTEKQLDEIIERGRPDCPDGFQQNDVRPALRLFDDPVYGDVSIVPTFAPCLSVVGRYYFVGGKVVPRRFNRKLDDYFATACN